MKKSAFPDDGEKEYADRTFSGLNLKNARLESRSFSSCVFRSCDLAGAIFNDTDLAGADLSAARNYAINPSSNKIKGAKFSLPEAMSLLYSMDIKIV